MKKKIIRYLPYVLVGLFATNLAEGWRLLEQTDFWDRVVALPDGIGIALQNPLPSFHPIDLIFGALFAVVMYTAVYLKSKNAKKYRHGIADLKKTIIAYAKTRETYIAYRKSGYSKKFLAEHEQEITMHKAAKARFDELGLEKLPRVKDLSEEYGEVLAKKKAAYSRYKEVRRNMEDILIAKKNVDILLSDDTAKKLYPEQNRG